MFLDSEMVANTKNVLAEDKYNKINVESPLFLCFVFLDNSAFSNVTMYLEYMINQ